MPSPLTIGLNQSDFVEVTREIDRADAAITAGYWFLWVRCPACRTTNAIDLRTLDRHHDAAVTSLISAFSHNCPVGSCRQGLDGRWSREGGFSFIFTREGT